MSSKNTTLSVVNFSGKNITNTLVTDVLAHDWDYCPPERMDPFRPDLNFAGAAIRNLDARCERQEINAAATEGANFTVTFFFEDQSWLRFKVNQRDALSKLSGAYDVEKSAVNAHLEVHRVTGTDGEACSNAFYIRRAGEPDNSCWMRDLVAARPDVTLNELTMPGSHDAGLYEDNSKSVSLGALQNGGAEWAVTQHLDIGKQLQAGARYFDLRVYRDNAGVLWAYHGQFKGAVFYGAFGGKFEDILDDVRRFLDHSGSEEAVFLSIQPYDGAWDLQKTVNLVKSKLAGRLYTSAHQPSFARMKLADLQGKVVAAFDKSFRHLWDPSHGLFRHQNCAKEGGGLWPVNGGLAVYDLYSDTNSFPTMDGDQTHKVNTYGRYGQPYLFLLSWILTGQTGGVLDLDLLSGYANAQLPKKLRELADAGTLPNIVYLDQVDPYLCSAIIALNSVSAANPVLGPQPIVAAS